MGKYEISDTLYVISCCSCGIVFGLPDRLDNALRRNGETFHCPNGHKLSYTAGKNLEDWNKLAKEQEEEIKNLKIQLAQKTHHLDQLGAQLNVPIMENSASIMENEEPIKESAGDEDGA